jgi:hypothetical protein
LQGAEFSLVFAPEGESRREKGAMRLPAVVLANTGCEFEPAAQKDLHGQAEVCLCGGIRAVAASPHVSLLAHFSSS